MFECTYIYIYTCVHIIKYASVKKCRQCDFDINLAKCSQLSFVDAGVSKRDCYSPSSSASAEGAVVHAVTAASICPFAIAKLPPADGTIPLLDPALKSLSTYDSGAIMSCLLAFLPSRARFVSAPRRQHRHGFFRVRLDLELALESELFQLVQYKLGY